jgi:hypothetical protein
MSSGGVEEGLTGVFEEELALFSLIRCASRSAMRDCVDGSGAVSVGDAAVVVIDGEDGGGSASAATGSLVELGE